LPLLLSGMEWPGEGVEPEGRIARRLRIKRDQIAAALMVRRSLDARQRRKRWVANYRVTLTTPELERRVLERGLAGVRAWTGRDAGRYGLVDAVPEIQQVRWSGPPPVVVGAGPAGLFAALRLAEAGAPAVLLERGRPVDQRVKSVNRFWRGAPLDPEDNVVFGEGGAGTFSDGKIYTRRRDGELGYIFRRLVDFGADPSILQEAWAHLGTDRVRRILPVLRQRLIELGATVRFEARVEGFVVEEPAAGGAPGERRCVGVRLAGGEVIDAGAVIVACGHSARDTAAAMLEAGAAAVARPVAIGARIEHPQEVIDQARYGEARGELPPASYRLAWEGEGIKARTFCMCPGGMVVPATNHPERVVVNGMSFSAQRAFWANSAVIIEVDPARYPGGDPLAGFRYQDAIEARAYALAGGTYAAPAQRVQDLLAGRTSASLPRTSFPQGVTPVDLQEVLPPEILGGLTAAVQAFERKLPGFAGPDAVLIAPETRTTAPLRFLRDERLHSTTLGGLLPVGEGAGYAGGIISAALDGLRAAESLLAER
jgi:uncharacterized FAD-dependent dehydrogenase